MKSTLLAMTLIQYVPGGPDVYMPLPYPPRPSVCVDGNGHQVDCLAEYHRWGGYDRGPIGTPDPRPYRQCIVTDNYGRNRVVRC